MKLPPWTKAMAAALRHETMLYERERGVLITLLPVPRPHRYARTFEPCTVHKFPHHGRARMAALRNMLARRAVELGLTHLDTPKKRRRSPKKQGSTDTR